MSIGSNIKRLREMHGMNQAELAEIAGVTDKAVSTWEHDKKIPRMGAIQKIADYFKITKSDIIEGDVFEVPVSPSILPIEYASNVPAYVRIPVVGEIVAGLPTEAIEDAIDWEEISFDQAQRGDYIGLRVKGHSMEPRICEGDTVIIRRQDTIENGELAVVFVNGDDATLKRVKLVDGGIMLIAFNQDVYEPHFYSEKMIRELPVTIYGKVVELRGKF